MKLRYDPKTLPYKQMRRLAWFLLAPSKAKPMRGGLVAPGVERIISGHSSAYLVTADQATGTYILVDTGMETDAGNIHATLREKGIDDSAIQAIFITHGHIDHASGAGTFPNAAVYAGEAEKSYLLGKRSGESFVGKIAGKLDSATHASEERIQSVTDGQRIAVGNLTVDVIAVPGHTSGSMTYVIGQTAFVGDAVFFQANGQANLPPLPLTADNHAAQVSLRMLGGRLRQQYPQVKMVVPGHSGEGMVEALLEYAAKNKQ